MMREKLTHLLNYFSEVPPTVTKIILANIFLITIATIATAIVALTTHIAEG
jgi:hypothetical protein